MPDIATTPEPPYYAVIFSSIRTKADNGYAVMAEKMVALAARQPGFLGVESAREQIGITVSYWENTESIRGWQRNSEHLFAQKKGRELWYKEFIIRICKVERDYSFAINFNR